MAIPMPNSQTHILDPSFPLPMLSHPSRSLSRFLLPHPLTYRYIQTIWNSIRNINGFRVCFSSFFPSLLLSSRYIISCSLRYSFLNSFVPCFSLRRPFPLTLLRSFFLPLFLSRSLSILSSLTLSARLDHCPMEFVI